MLILIIWRARFEKLRQKNWLLSISVDILYWTVTRSQRSKSRFDQKSHHGERIAIIVKVTKHLILKLLTTLVFSYFKFKNAFFL